MFGLFSPKKPLSAEVNSATVKLEVAANDNLLNAALKSGLAWPHNCRVGSCGTCRCKLIDGKIKPLNDFGYVLDNDELDQGFILACQTRLRTDISVEVDLEDDAAQLAKAESVAGTINSIRPLTHDIVEVIIELEQALPDYIAGQYADLTFDGVDDARSYSFAQAPVLGNPSSARFYVRKVPGGQVSNLLHDVDSVGSQVAVSGPHGTFYLRTSDAPALCIAGGSGLAPVKALLEQLAYDGFDRKVVFLFGAREQRDLYCLEEMEQISRENSQFTFIPILSEEKQDSDWAGRRGMVTEFIQEQGLNISQCQAYLCGPPPMIDAAIEVLEKEGMDSQQIFFDKFLDASHLPGGKR